MSWLTSLPVWAILFLALVLVGSASAASYAFLHSRTGEHRERTGLAAAAYMTALGSLFAILTGFLINSEFATLRQAQSLVGKEAAAASRLAWATEALPSVDTGLVQQRLGVYLFDSEKSDFKAFGTEKAQNAQTSAGFSSLRELQSVAFTISSRPYVASATANAIEESMADLTDVRRELLSIADSEMPIELLLLSVIAGFALIINALFVALRSGGNTVYVAVGIILIVALDLALIVGISAPFRGPFVVDSGPVQTMATEVQSGVYLPWVGPKRVIETSAKSCTNDESSCVRIEPGDPVQLAALLRIGKDSDAAGLDDLRGFQLAIDYLDGKFDGENGQLLGHDVAVWEVDDQCSPEGGRSGAGQLLNDKSLVAVVGTTCSGAAKAAKPLFADAGVLMISGQNTAPVLTVDPPPNSTYFRTAPNDLIQGSVVAGFVGGQLNLDRIAIVSDGSVYSEELGSVFESKIGSYGVTATQTFQSPEGSDYTATAVAIANGGYDGIFMPVNSPVCENLMDAISANAATKNLPVITGDACVLAGVLPSAKKVNAYGSGPDVTALDKQPFYRDEYVIAYRSKFGQAPLSVWNTAAFDAANLIFDAIQRVAIEGKDGSLLIPRRTLVEAIGAVDGYAGVSNKLVCLPTGDCAQAGTIGIFKAPAWPVGSDSQSAQPVFSKTETLASVLRRK
ncbi:MAG: branched-chain amino acid ABC transporter substrate-binding protein [Actinomycetes bacterium]